MRKIVALLIPVLLLAACNPPLATPNAGTTPGNSQKCFYTWATQAQPVLSTQVQAAMRTAGLTNVQARADAYGENCTDPQTNQPVSFSVLETDFHINVKVSDLTNQDDLGNSLEKILTVLDGFPPGKIPGPQAGTISVSFEASGDALNLMFSVPAGKSARDLGLHGAALLERLQNKMTPTWEPIPTGSPLPPYATPTAFTSAPLDKTLDAACRKTINSFFSIRPGDDPQSYRDLFTPSRFDNFPPPAEARTLSELMPASQEWLRDFPGTPVPGAIIPEGPNEYVYYVEFVYRHEAQDATPAYSSPDFMTVTMLADGPNSCKIDNYGKG